MNLDEAPLAAPLAVPIRATLLRSVLLLELDRAGGRDLTVAQLGRAVERRGFTVRGRLGKVISDTLRTELDLGRVSRVGRGRYRLRHLPRTTRWRCHQRIRAARAGTAPPWHLAEVDGQQPAASCRSVAPLWPSVRRGAESLVAQSRNEPPTADQRATLLGAARTARLAERQRGSPRGIAAGPGP